MGLQLERYIARRRLIIFSGRLEVSSSSLVQIVREFFGAPALLHRVEFGDQFCWIGFRPREIGNLDHRYVRIESVLGIRTGEDGTFQLLDLPPVDVGSVSIRSLSPVASRVLIRINYTPEVLADFFQQLTEYMLTAVYDEEYAQAWSSRFLQPEIKVIKSVDSINLPQPEEQASTHELDAGQPSPATPTAESSKKSTGTKKAKRRRSKRKAAGKATKRKICLPSNPMIREQWRKMWRIIRQAQRSYMNPPNDTEEERPNPTYDDFRQAIKERLNLKRSEKTVQRVIKAGRAGLLKK